MSDTNPLFVIDLQPSWSRGTVAQAGSSLFDAPAKVAGAESPPQTKTVVVKKRRNPSFGDNFQWVAIESLTADQSPTVDVVFSYVDSIATIAKAKLRTAGELVRARGGILGKVRYLTSDATAFSNVEIVDGGWKPELSFYLKSLRTFFKRDYGVALAARLEALDALAREDDEQAPPSISSVAQLMRFLESQNVNRPRLALSPAGEVLAIWRQEGVGEFTARFLASGAVRFLLAKRDPEHHDGISRVSGDTTVGELYSIAGLTNLDWVKAWPAQR